MGSLRSVAFHPNGKTIAVGGGGARLWDIERTGNGYTFKDRQRLPWQYTYGEVNTIAFAAEGKFLLTAGDGLALIWDLADNRLITTAERNVPPVAISPDGQSLIITKYRELPQGRGNAYVRILDINAETQPQAISREVLQAVEDIVNYGKTPRNLASSARFEHAMRSLGPHAGVGAPRLTEALSDPDHNARDRALQALANIGPAAKVAVPQLTKMLLDESPGIRRMVASTLRHITPETAEPLIYQAQQELAQNPHQPELRDGTWTYEGSSLTRWLQMAGRRSTGWIAPQSGSPAQRRSEKGIEEKGIEAIGDVAIPDIRKELKNPDWLTRAGAAGALTLFESTSAEGIETLTDVMVDGPDKIAWSAAGWLTQALQRTATKPPPQLDGSSRQRECDQASCKR